MAIHANSTPVPAPQRGLLRASAHSGAVPALDLLPRFGEKPLPKSGEPNGSTVLAKIGEKPSSFELPNSGDLTPAALLADPESTTAQPCNASGLTPEQALASIAAQGLLPDAEARALFSRRRLGEALEFGFALLDALDLPPLALDVIDDAIAALDALDAPHEDLEDDDPAEETSLETAGRGLVRCGADDDEDGFDIEEQHDAEQTYEDGSEDEPYPWRFQLDAWALVAGALHV